MPDLGQPTTNILGYIWGGVWAVVWGVFGEAIGAFFGEDCERVGGCCIVIKFVLADKSRLSCCVVIGLKLDAPNVQAGAICLHTSL